MSKVTIISGSPSEHTRLNGVLHGVINHLNGVGITPEIINIRNLPSEDLIQARFDSEEIIKQNKKVEHSKSGRDTDSGLQSILFRSIKNLLGSSSAKWSRRQNDLTHCCWWNFWLLINA